MQYVTSHKVKHSHHTILKFYLRVELGRLGILNPLMPGGNKKVTHTETNLQLKAAGLFKYVL